MSRLTEVIRFLVALTASTTVGISGASACRMTSPLVVDDVRHADVVVIGTVADYRIVRDEAFRARMLKLPTLSADLRRFYSDPAKFLVSDYARFTIEVSDVLKGKSPKTLSVTWNNSTFGEPAAFAPGRYLFALRRPDSPAPPLRGPSAYIPPNPDPASLTLLQAPCSEAFLFPADSSEAMKIRQRLLRSAP